MGSSSTRNAYSGTSSSGEESGITTFPPNHNPTIKNIYKGTRQINLGVQLGFINHTGLIMETTQGKYIICEYMDDSEVHYYYIDKPSLKGNNFDDGKYVWKIENICQSEIQWNILKTMAEECTGGTYKLLTNNCQHFFDRIYKKICDYPKK